MSFATFIITWTLRLAIAVLITRWFLQTRTGRFLRGASFKLDADSNELVLLLRNVSHVVLKASSFTVNFALLEFRIPNYFERRTSVARANRCMPSVVAQDVAVRYLSPTKSPSTKQSWGLYLGGHIFRLFDWTSISVSAPITIKGLSIEYCGQRSDYTLDIEELYGKVTVGSKLSLTAEELSVRLVSNDGVDVADCCGRVLVMETTIRQGEFVSSLRGSAFTVKPALPQITALAARTAKNATASSTVPTKEAGTALETGKPDSSEDRMETTDTGFLLVSTQFSLKDSSDAVVITSSHLSLTFTTQCQSTPPDPNQPQLTSTKPTTIVPFAVANVHLRMLNGASGAPAAAMPAGDEFEIVETADRLATGAASGSMSPLTEPPQSALPTTAQTAVKDKTSRGGHPSLGCGRVGATDAAASSSSPDKAASMGSRNPAVVLAADSLRIVIQQQVGSFKQMSRDAGQLLSDMKTLFAGEAQPSSGATGNQPYTSVNAKVDDVSVTIDRSTAKTATLSYGVAAGVLAEEVNIQIMTVVPVMSCYMASVNLRTGGEMAIESLVLEAGRLGKLLLFKLEAQGVGYTPDIREMVLVKCSTKIGGAQVMASERWSGTLEKVTNDKEGAESQQVVRRVVVPPGVRLTQVFRLAPALPQAVKDTEPLQKAIVTLRPLDVAAVSCLPTSAPSPSSVSQKFPPAGFGLDVLPGFKTGFCFDFAVQPPMLPKLPTREQGLAAAAGMLKSAFRL